MKIHHLRNATMVIESDDKFILVDPMLGKKGSGMPFTLFRFKPKRNPIVELPSQSSEILKKVTHCLVTHLHPDHLDKDAISFLKSRNIPVVCNAKDESVLRKHGLNVSKSLSFWKEDTFLDGKIVGIPAIHGHGFMVKPMGEVMGYYLQLPNEKSIYISADTVYTEHVEKVLKEYKPDVAVLACGTAQLDFGKPILMQMDEMIRFIKTAPGKVFANHLEALNHCPTSRESLKSEVAKLGLQHKVFIPQDGESISY